MCRLSFRDSGIEHIIPQKILRKIDAEKALDYSDLTIYWDTSNVGKHFLD